MIDGPEKIRWSLEQRLEFIEFRLFWEGQLNRADLVDKFGISIPQASADLTRYQELAPNNLHYDKSQKTYVATENFQPVVTQPTARQYLAQLRSLADGVLRQQETWLGWVPSFFVVPLVRRRLDADKLRSIVTAIHHGSAVSVEYQSFTRPQPVWRWVTPHALGFDGFRWHARAWCHEHLEFRDFVLARMLALGETKSDQIDPLADREWQTEVAFRLAPHPKLKGGQRRGIELDYGMEDGFVEIKTRVCLSYYLERHLGLDLDPDKIPPERQQIVLANRPEVQAIRQAASQNTEKKAGYG